MDDQGRKDRALVGTKIRRQEGRKAQRTIGRKTCKIVNEIGRKRKRELYTTFHNVRDCQGPKIELMGLQRKEIQMNQ